MNVGKFVGYLVQVKRFEITSGVEENANVIKYYLMCR